MQTGQALQHVHQDSAVSISAVEQNITHCLQKNLHWVPHPAVTGYTPPPQLGSASLPAAAALVELSLDGAPDTRPGMPFSPVNEDTDAVRPEIATRLWEARPSGTVYGPHLLR